MEISPSIATAGAHADHEPTARTIDGWLSACIEALEEIAGQLLQVDGARMLERREGLPRFDHGTQVAIVEAQPVLLGLFSDAAGCRWMAAQLLGMGPDEASASDVADAVGEVGNTLAGMIKRRFDLAGALGFPVFIHGHIEPGGGTQARIARVAMGPIELEVVVLWPGGRAEA